jgi:transcriptional regulator with XRE-family HTH domain
MQYLPRRLLTSAPSMSVALNRFDQAENELRQQRSQWNASDCSKSFLMLFPLTPSDVQPYIKRNAALSSHRIGVHSVSSFVLATRESTREKPAMIGERLRTLRKDRNLSQGDIEERTGLQRCYVSRVENGHTIPSLETLQKMALALEVPLYKFFYEGDEPPQAPPLPIVKKKAAEEWGFSGKWGQFVGRLRSLLGKMEENDRQLLLLMAYKMARKR